MSHEVGGIPVYSARRLALAVCLQAFQDAHAGDPSAESWLKSTGRSWMALSNICIDPEDIKTALQRPNPDLRTLTHAQLITEELRTWQFMSPDL